MTAESSGLRTCAMLVAVVSSEGSVYRPRDARFRLPLGAMRSFSKVLLRRHNSTVMK
jgi:hypothetical protein